jgi:histidinol-phosphate/aromatic aminotransferase/cobyric acid decarboxylase-like protein
VTPSAGRRTAWAVLALALAVVLFAPRGAAAQDASAPAVKAAFLFNFAKLTEWPADAVPSGAPLVLCVLGDAQVAASLEDAVKGRSVERRELIVRRVSADDAGSRCQLLYISGLAAKQLTALVQSLNQMPTLTVSDLPRSPNRAASSTSSWKMAGCAS